MSKFNQTNTIKTTNNSGYVAYSMEEKEKLVTQVLTSFFGEAKYYGDNTTDLIANANSIVKKDPKFVANLARYARKEMHLRSVAHALTALVAYNVESKQYIREVVSDVVERPDDITEILACYIGMYGKPIANGLKKALGNAIKKFNAYEISKYNGGQKSIKFKDLLRITHVKPDNEQQEKLFSDIINDTLPIAVRWETELSDNGNNAETWEKLIAENRIGYMAMLRNFRNIIKAKPNNIDKVFEKLSDKEQVLKSKQLPFRFLSAYKELPDGTSSKAVNAISNALEYSVENIPKLKGTTVIAVDISGSMGYNISEHSSVTYSDIANLLGAMSSKICEDAIFFVFNTGCQQVISSTNEPILSIAKQIPMPIGGTNLTLPIQAMIQEQIKADRLIVISDNEINHGFRTCQSYVDDYRNKFNQNLWVHAIDIAGYGTQQFVGKKTNIIAGWNERVLEFINIVENDMENQVKLIENYK